MTIKAKTWDDGCEMAGEETEKKVPDAERDIDQMAQVQNLFNLKNFCDQIH